MINVLWASMIIISFISAFFTGNFQKLSNTVIEEAKSTINLLVTLSGNICFWSGIFKIMEKCKVTDKLSLFFAPLINLIFKDVKNKETKNAISMNITANILGMGNAATPFGLKAMGLLDKENNHRKKASNAMCRFVLMNTASLQILPTGIMALRQNYGGETNTNLVVCILISSLCACVFGLILCFVFERLKR